MLWIIGEEICHWWKESTFNEQFRIIVCDKWFIPITTFAVIRESKFVTLRTLKHTICIEYMTVVLLPTNKSTVQGHNNIVFNLSMECFVKNLLYQFNT